MKANTQTFVSITDANQNFSKVASLVDEYGSAVILDNDVPRYLVVNFDKAEESAVGDDDVMAVSRAIMTRNKEAYEVLAK